MAWERTIRTEDTNKALKCSMLWSSVSRTQVLGLAVPPQTAPFPLSCCGSSEIKLYFTSLFLSWVVNLQNSGNMYTHL